MPIPTIHRKFDRRDYVGGDPVLDFVNTVNGRDGSPVDWIDGFPRLVEWASGSGAFRPRGLSPVLAKSRRSPRRASEAVFRARRLREALYAIFRSAAVSSPAPPGAVAILEREWKRGAAISTFTSARPAAPELDPRRAGLDLVTLEMASRAVALLAEMPDLRLRQCNGSDCAWLFLDTSKAGRRRWCDMATCGNVAKARRHRRCRGGARPRPPGRRARDTIRQP